MVGEDRDTAGHGFKEADTEHFFGGRMHVEIHGLVDGGHGVEGLVFEDGDPATGAGQALLGVAFDGRGIVGGGTGEEEMEAGGQRPVFTSLRRDRSDAVQPKAWREKR